MTRSKWKYIGVDWSRMENFVAHPLGQERAKILSVLQRANRPLTVEEIKPFVDYTEGSIVRFLKQCCEFGLVEPIE